VASLARLRMRPTTPLFLAVVSSWNIVLVGCVVIKVSLNQIGITVNTIPRGSEPSPV
jgi:hypothetical protein